MAATQQTPVRLAARIGRAARQAREQAGLTQSDVAERVDVVTEVYGRIENGHMLPSVPTLLRLCEALGMDANSLLGLKRQTASAARKPSPRGRRRARSLAEDLGR